MTTQTPVCVDDSAAELEYRSRITLTIQYLQEHLDETLSLEVLARIAGFSPYHFHRIYAAFMGETLGETIRRLRLETAARLLCTTHLPITEIALHVGYETPAAFAQACKQVYGSAPSELRKAGWDSVILRSPKTRKGNVRRTSMKPEIRELPEQSILYVRRIGAVNNNFTRAANSAFRALNAHIETHHLWNKLGDCLGICPDDPSSSPPEECRYDAGFIIKPGADIQPSGEVGIQTLPAGRFAVFTHKGSYDVLWKTWGKIYHEWLPASGVTLRDALPYEACLDDKDSPIEQLRTEIFIPIE